MKGADGRTRHLRRRGRKGERKVGGAEKRAKAILAARVEIIARFNRSITAALVTILAPCREREGERERDNKTQSTPAVSRVA